MSLFFTLRDLPKWLRNLTASSRIPCADDLTKVVRRERARADRSGGEFCFLTFAAAGTGTNDYMLKQLTKNLARRIRIIDEYAVMPDNRLWLILPDCPAVAAARIAREICEQSSTEQQRITYDLFHYRANSKGHRNHCEQNCRASAQIGHDETERMPPTNKPRIGSDRGMISPLVRRMPLWKRILDIVIASVCLVLLTPLLVLISLLIKLTSTGPVLYVQRRAGRSGKPFFMYKFRTMEADAELRKTELLSRNEQDGPAFKMERDPRITRFGRFLRATSTDELPQLWNVLLGQMSLVGPRPLPIQESAACESWHHERLDVTPGLTCTWQVCDRRSRIPFAEWMRMDIRYARSGSLALDLLLMLKTLVFMIRRKGI
jgi:lipopolysaccharide/colanic/teichoic acid biosynthesis glycosyltransferase